MDTFLDHWDRVSRVEGGPIAPATLACARAGSVVAARRVRAEATAGVLARQAGDTRAALALCRRSGGSAEIVRLAARLRAQRDVAIAWHVRAADLAGQPATPTMAR